MGRSSVKRLIYAMAFSRRCCPESFISEGDCSKPKWSRFPCRHKAGRGRRLAVDAAAEEFDVRVAARNPRACVHQPACHFLMDIGDERKHLDLRRLELIAEVGRGRDRDHLASIDPERPLEDLVLPQVVGERIEAGAARAAFQLPADGEVQPGAPQQDRRLVPFLPRAERRFELPHLAGLFALRPVEEDHVESGRVPGLEGLAGLRLD